MGSSESGVGSREIGVGSNESGVASREPGVGSSESGEYIKLIALTNHSPKGLNLNRPGG